jgi:hypothetical protein
LLEEIASADRLVLLGDIVETRELPLPTVLEVARPFFEDLGEAMAGRGVVLVPGNHDHRFAEPLLEEAIAAGRGLGLEEIGKPDSGAAGRIAGWLGEAEAIVAYPGIWLREDVYATHGHYMDCHMSLPRIECLAAAALMRVYGPLSDPAAPEDYERVLRPIYGLSDGLAQANLAQPELVQRTRPSEQAWQAISGQDGGRGGVKRVAMRAAIAGGIPATVWTLNRLLRADFDPDLSAAAITRSGIDAATELARRLRIGAAHTITGHTHRAGPEAGEQEWVLPGGGRLHNTGSWIFASAFHHPGTPPGPYWPGTVTWVEDEGPPRRVRLLDERPRDELKAMARRASRSG